MLHVRRRRRRYGPGPRWGLGGPHPPLRAPFLGRATRQHGGWGRGAPAARRRVRCSGPGAPRHHALLSCRNLNETKAALFGEFSRESQPAGAGRRQLRTGVSTYPQDSQTAKPRGL